MTRTNSFLLYLYTLRNIAGCSLGLLGISLYLTGVIDQWWFPISVGLYAVGALLVPAQNSMDADVYQQYAGYDGKRLVESVEQLLQQTQKQLPVEAVALLRSIPPTLESLLPRMAGSRASPASPMLPPDQVQTVVGAITRDLPQTIAGYVRLPVAFANLHPLQQGKTAKNLLLEQLQLLKEQLDKIAEAAFKDDADALLTNGRYLQEKFHAPTYLQ